MKRNPNFFRKDIPDQDNRTYNYKTLKTDKYDSTTKTIMTWDSPINYFTAEGYVPDDVNVGNLFAYTEDSGITLYVTNTSRIYVGTEKPLILTLTLPETEEYEEGKFYVYLNNVDSTTLTKRISITCTR